MFDRIKDQDICFSLLPVGLLGKILNPLSVPAEVKHGRLHHQVLFFLSGTLLKCIVKTPSLWKNNVTQRV